MCEQVPKQGAEPVGSAGEKRQVMAAFSDGLDPVCVCSVPVLLLYRSSMSSCCDRHGGQGDRLLKHPPWLSTDRCQHRWLCNVWCEKRARVDRRNKGKRNGQRQLFSRTSSSRYSWARFSSQVQECECKPPTSTWILEQMGSWWGSIGREAPPGDRVLPDCGKQTQG